MKRPIVSYVPFQDTLFDGLGPVGVTSHAILGRPALSLTIVVRAAMKPIATLRKALASVDVRTKEAFEAAFERSDICAVAAASVVGEAMIAITLADAYLEKFAGDSLTEMQRNVEGYREQLRRY